MLSPQAIAASSYEGWVAWVDGIPIFEEVVESPRLAPLSNGHARERRPADRNVMDWSDLPHEKLRCVELYFDRALIRAQPRIRIDREAGADLRFIQFKRGSLSLPSVSGVPGGLSADELARAGYPLGQTRSGVVGYCLGYWDRRRGFTELICVKRGEPHNFRPPPRGHPCWPRPYGFGFAPAAVGLNPAAVPDLPANLKAMLRES